MQSVIISHQRRRQPKQPSMLFTRCVADSGAMPAFEMRRSVEALGKTKRGAGGDGPSNCRLLDDRIPGMPTRHIGRESGVVG